MSGVALIKQAAKTPAVPEAGGASLTVELARDLNLPQEDRDALDQLIEQRPATGVFSSRAWLSGFFAEPPARVDPMLAIIRNGSTLTGMAPLGIYKKSARTHVQLLGGGYGSDRVDLLAARGYEAVCSDALLRWVAESLGHKGWVFELRDVPHDSPIWGAIDRAAQERTLRVVLQPREIHTLPYLSLAGTDSERASNPLSIAARRSLEKHRRMLERRGRLRLELLHERSDVMAAFESLVGFLHARWAGHGSRSVLDDPRLLRFHRHTLPLLLAEGRLRMIRMSSDMRPIAVFYGIADSGWWGYFLAGYDRAWAGRIHLGQLILAGAIEIAAREGAAEFDFLKGAERIKYLWPVRERATLDADVYSHHAAPQVERAVRAARDAAAALGKSARSLFER